MQSHRTRVQELIDSAAADHERLIAQLAPDLRESLPVDAQGLTSAIDHLATAAGFSDGERRALIRPHGVNPAVLHARVFGSAPLARGTVIGAFVEGARVRAEALTALADAIGGELLGLSVRKLLGAHPPPASVDAADAVATLRGTYAAQEDAAMLIAASLDEDGG